jgi:hypothetical protein
MPPEMTVGETVLFRLQREQLEHDQKFHREIAQLSLHARLNHMALHFCKYTGQLADICANGDTNGMRQRTITDSFIISLCCANALNILLEDHTEGAYLENFNDLQGMGRYLAKRLYSQAQFGDAWALTSYAVQAGHMARACEKIDHLESFPFREVIVNSVVDLFRIALIYAALNEIDPEESVPARRQEVRRRSIFSDMD